MLQPARVVYKTYVTVENIPYLSGHQVNGVMIVPVALFVELAIAGSRALVG